MLTHKDIENLTKYQLEVFKDVFATKEDLSELSGKFDKLQTTVDVIVKDVQDIKIDNKIMNHRVKNVENWIDEASPKVGVKFEH